MQTQVHISYLALLALEHSKGFSVSRISYGLLKGFYSLSALSTPPGKHHTSPATSGLVRRHRWLSSSPIISEQQGVISHREAALCIFRMRCFHSILSSLASSLALFWQVNRRSRNEGTRLIICEGKLKGIFSFRVYPTGFTVDPKIASIGVRDGEFLSEHLCPLWQSRGIWRLKVFGVITTRTWLDTPGLCDPESTGKVWAWLPISLRCILILHETEDQFEGSVCFFFFFAGEYIFKNEHTVGYETLREPIDFHVLGSRVQEDPVTVDAVGSTLLCSDPCRPCWEPLMGCLDSLQQLHIHCVLRITLLKSVAWYLSWFCGGLSRCCGHLPKRLRQ